MRSILTVTVAADAPYRLTTVAAMRRALDLSAASDDDVERVIDAAGSAIVAALGYPVARETVSETFRPHGGGWAEVLTLARTPVISIATVTLDGTVLASGEYEADKAAGLLYRLDSSGQPCSWSVATSAVVVYTAGWILPGLAGATLDAALEAGCIELASGYWQARGRDPLIRGEEVPGVLRTDYWVGSAGEAGELPPGVLAKIAPFRRVTA